MKYLSVIAVFCFIAIVAAGQFGYAKVPRTLHRLRRQSQSFSAQSSSSSSSSTATGTNGQPITQFQQSSSSYHSGGPAVGVPNLADRFGPEENGNNQQSTGFVSGHIASTGGFIYPGGQTQLTHNYYQQIPPQYPNNNYQQQKN
ncbi:uncharacterized protein LOC129571613 [Sitodiplosis mosellana]|uniref:uncharacterized protein LOC129571613 n=1 Tax=Sitodiplosis mosellana TaxID=263140 RepID=UPI0024446E26|nr:uncharacterized protein LOC129571613 [Sitodiplosis mosellana]